MADIISRLKLESGEFDSKIKRAAQGINQMVAEARKMNSTLINAAGNTEEEVKANMKYIQSLGRMETVSQTARGKLAELTAGFTDLKHAYNQLSQEEKNGNVGLELNKQLEILKRRIAESKNELKGIEQELSGSNSKFGEFGGLIDNIGSRFGITGNLTELLTSKTAMMTGAIGASIAVVTKATEAWAGYNAELAKQDQITTVTTGLQGGDSENMTSAMRALARTYDVDFRDAVNAANTLMTQFGATGDEAIQLLRDGMRGMIMGDGPKLLSMIQQYAPAFRDAGVSASQLVAVIQNSEGGIFTDQNMNAIVMGIKNIRLMTKATSDALAKMGIDGAEMSKQLSNGTITIFDALKKVATAIEGTNSSSQAAGEVMQQVFGRQGAMAGTKLGEAIATLNTNLDETKRQTGELGGSMDELYEANRRLETAIRDCFGYDGWQQMANGIKTKLVTALADVLDLTVKIKESTVGQISGTIFDTITRSAVGLLGPLGKIVKFLSIIKGGSSENAAGAGGAIGGVLGNEKNTADILPEVVVYGHKPTKGNKPKGGSKTTKQDVQFADDSIMAQEKLVQELTQKWKTASAEMKDGYLVQLNEAKAKLAEMTAIKPEAGSLKDYQEQLKAANADITTMREELLRMKDAGEDPIAISTKEDQLNAAIQKVSDLQNKIDYLNGKEVSLDIVINGENNTDMGEALITDLQDSLINAADNLDLTAFTEKWIEAMADGAEEADYSAYFENMRAALEDSIDAEEWPKIKIAIETGDIKTIQDYQKKVQDSSKKTEEGWKQATGAIGQLGNALNSIEDPTTKVLGTVLQGIAGVAAGFGNAAKGPFTSPWEYIAFAASGIAAMISAITAIHSATGFANGGIVKAADGAFVPGNSYSGDMVPAMLNSGELVLNRAQVGNLAAQLEDGRQSGVQSSQPYIDGELLFLGLQAYTRRSGMGELVFAK